MMPGMKAHIPPSDATTIIANIDPEQIRQRLAQIDAERSSLRVLLRAAEARRRTLAEHDVTAAPAPTHGVKS
jgi:hypothetical protein